MPRPTKSIEEQLLRENPDLRAQGLRPEIVWVPDFTAPEYQRELDRQLVAIRNSPQEAEIMEWIEQVSAWPKD